MEQEYTDRQMEMTVHREAGRPGAGTVLVGGMEVGRVFRAQNGTEGAWFAVMHGQALPTWASKRRNFRSLEADLVSGWDGGGAVAGDFWVWVLTEGRSLRLMHGRTPMGWVERVGDSDRRWRVRYDGHRESAVEGRWYWTVGLALEDLRAEVARSFGADDYRDICPEEGPEDA